MAKVWIDGVDVMAHADGFVTLAKGSDFSGDDLATDLVEFMVAQKMPVDRYAVFMPEVRKLPEGQRTFPAATVAKEWAKHKNAVVLASRFGKPYLLIGPKPANAPTRRKTVLTKLSPPANKIIVTRSLKGMK